MLPARITVPIAWVVAALVVLAACTRDSTPALPPVATDVQTTTSTDPATSAPAAPTRPTTATTARPASAGDSPTASGEEVRTGAEVLAGSGFEALQGKRVGLIAHRASMIGTDRVADRLASDPGVELGALFAPEHGLFGSAGPGAIVDDAFDPATGVPVFSLYDADRAPTPESLTDLDVLVYDLQDVGTRFYTYISTMGLAMQAAADSDVQFMVLDRPNPIGGAVRGPVRRDELESFISLYPIPAAYGLTAGELATFIAGEGLLPGLAGLDLVVVPMTGWTRSARWTETGLDWVPPSPNLRTPEAALLYPGLVLFEATDLSVGRGTDTPFQLVGAPWLEGIPYAAQLNRLGLPGVRFDDVTFTPDGEVEEHWGLRIEVTDPDVVDGWSVGLHVMRKMLDGAKIASPPVDVIARPDVFDRLAGDPNIRIELEAGTEAAALAASFGPEEATFARRVEPYRLYP